MTFNTALLLSLLTLLTSCNGQSASKSADTHAKISVGDTVSEISKGIWYVFQDAKLNYWFGSDTSGVYRFDGKTIVQFTTKHGLSSNRIRGIQEDKYGNMYFTTLEGINKFDGQNFTTLQAELSGSPENNWQLQHDDLWFHTLGKNGEKGPYRYDGKHLYQLQFPKHYLEEEYFAKFPNNAWSPYDIYYIYKDSKGTMWFGTSNFGICRYDGKSLRWLYEDHLTNTPSGGSFGIRSILEDRNGQYWFCNTRYRYNILPDSINGSRKDLVNYTKETGINGIKSADGTGYVYFLSIAEDNNGNTWMVTYNEGVWRYDGKNTTHYAVKDGTKDITLFSIYKDRKGELWLGTHEAGVYRFNGKTFEKFKIN